MNFLLRLSLLLLIAVALFDPADLLLGAKVPLFIMIWVIFFIDIAISNRGRYPVPIQLYCYVAAFSVFIPALGMLVYILRGGGLEGYDGFKYLKAYLFLSLCIPLAAKRLDLVRGLCILLTFLSLATIAIYLVTINDELFRNQLALFGNAFLVFSITDRSYGTLSYQLVYFNASPLIALSIVYYSYRMLNSSGKRKFFNLLLLVINVCGMALSGTRNNIIVAVVAPLLVFAWYRPGRPRLVLTAVLAVIIITGLSLGVIQEMFSTDEYSNAVKLGHLQDYRTLFSDWRTLVFGQGMGAAFFSTTWETETSVTELTYLEILRNYGLLFSPLLFALIFYPLRKLGRRTSQADHYLFLGYLCYLFLCIANPLLMDSTGMLVLTVILYRTFCSSSGQPLDAAASAGLLHKRSSAEALG